MLNQHEGREKEQQAPGSITHGKEKWSGTGTVERERDGSQSASGGCIRTFGADEAPADVDVFVVLDAPPRGEVVWTDDAVVGEDHAAGGHAQVVGVVGYGAANAANQATCTRNTASARPVHAAAAIGRASTFGDGRAAGIGDEARETDVDGAAEASAHRCRRRVAGDTFAVIELPTDGDHTAADVLAALLTHKAGVDTWRRRQRPSRPQPEVSLHLRGSRLEFLVSVVVSSPDLHSGQTNFPLGASAREMQGRWKAPQH